MKHALLIIAHKNIKQLDRLVSSLEHDSFDIFIHFDSKWAISDDEIEMFKHQHHNAEVLEKRYSGVLDTWSLVEIAMELIQKALYTETQKKIEYGYFYLMSGQDYPIKSNDYIAQYLDRAYPKPLIDCTPETNDNWIHSTFKRIRHVNLYNKINKISKNKTVQKICKIPLYAYQEVLTLIVGSPYKHLKAMNIRLYGGSAWWALPREAVGFITEQYKTNRQVVKWYRKATTPEETFFQTMTMMSPAAEKVVLNDPYETKQNCMTFTYFQREGKPVTGHPYSFTVNEIDKIQKMPHLFARKFDIDIDEKIFDIIEEKCR